MKARQWKRTHRVPLNMKVMCPICYRRGVVYYLYLQGEDEMFCIRCATTFLRLAVELIEKYLGMNPAERRRFLRLLLGFAEEGPDECHDEIGTGEPITSGPCR